MTKSEKLVC